MSSPNTLLKVFSGNLSRLGQPEVTVVEPKVIRPDDDLPLDLRCKFWVSAHNYILMSEEVSLHGSLLTRQLVASLVMFVMFGHILFILSPSHGVLLNAIV